MSRALRLESPFGLRFAAWLQERFPLAQAPLILVLFAAALCVGRALAADGPIVLRPSDGAGFLAFWSFLLLLRICDEHKDFARDLENHPERVLQSGLIQLGHLKAAGVACVALQLAVSLHADGGVGLVTLHWLVVMGWTSLMTVEFFCGAWLEKRLLLYAASHMLVTPLSMLWIVALGGARAGSDLAVLWLAALSFLTGAAFEVTRKTRGPDEERATVDSYTKILGVRGAAATIAALQLGSFAAQWLLLARLLPEFGIGWKLALGAGLGLPLASLAAFVRHATARGRGLNEAAVGVSMLLGHGVVIAALLIARGVAWTS